MARPIGSGRPNAFTPRRPTVLPKAAELEVVDLTFFRPAKGLDTTVHISQLPKENAAALVNYVLRRGRLEQRVPATVLGLAATSPVMYAAQFVTKSGAVIPFRLTTTGMETYSRFDQAWQAVPGVVFTGGLFDFFAVTAFGTKLLISNGVDGLWSYDPQTGKAIRISTSVKVPSARHLTTFNNRVIATNVTDNTGTHQDRVRWSVKNDESFWDEADPAHVGAGVEDQAASPELEADIARACVPITETIALLFRSRSTHIMSATGFVDAPFQFNLLFSEIGTDSPYSIDSIPGGAVGLFRDNFYVCTAQQPVPIGTQVIDTILPLIKDPLTIQGAYDAIRQEYRVIIPDTGAVWRYSFREKGWSTDVYPFAPRSLSVIKYDKTALTIDQLTGTIDSLTGSIDSLGRYQVVNGFFISYGSKVAREDPEQTLDAEAGTDGTEIRTGLILPRSPLEKVELVEIQLEYETRQGATLFFDWSSDGGATWTSIGSYAIGITNGPDVLSIRKQLSVKQLQIKMTTSSPVAPTIIAMHVFVLPGAMRRP